MTTRLSKILLLVEGFVFVLPVSLLFLTIIPGAFFFFTSFSAFAASALIVAISAALVATMVVISEFCNHGAEGLRTLPKIWWRLCFFGAAMSVMGATFAVLRKSIHLPGNDFFFVVKLAAYGV
ncbi:MAG: hypothetical protein U1F39_15805, partial [Steroidobacteraceae bacterium]